MGQWPGMNMKQFVKGIVFAAGLLATFNQAWAAENALLLENPRIAAEIDRQSGALEPIGYEYL